MLATADYLLRTAEGDVAAVVELKPAGRSLDPAVDQVRALAGRFGDAAGLVLTPERVVLVSGDRRAEGPAGPLFDRYLDEAGAVIADLRGPVWRMIAEDALDDLVIGAAPVPACWPPSLVEFAGRVRGGTVVREARG